MAEAGEDVDDLELHGIPLSLFIIMCSLACLGIVYAVAVLVFNIAKQNDKIIKMTSPNLNIVILLAIICGYVTMIMTGIDSKWVNHDTMAALLQGSAFVITISFTITYGSLFAKAWRIYMVFKNLNINGKMTRDEHLLLGVLVMVVLDLAILLPWALTDPIRCSSSLIHDLTITDSNVTEKAADQPVLIDVCLSELQGLWIGLLYLYKILMLLPGLYFTWQTRHVSIPSLRDGQEVAIVAYSLVSLALVCLPVLLVERVGMEVRYAVGGSALWIALTTTISFIFLPKIWMAKKQAEADSGDTTKFLFSESMKKTQEAIRKCSLCVCCGDQSDQDKYAQEVLSTEIDTLNRTIKQKDTTIRELNDRLMFGAERFQEYLSNPGNQKSLNKKQAGRTRSVPASKYEKDLLQQYRLERFHGVTDERTGGGSLASRGSSTITPYAAYSMESVSEETRRDEDIGLSKEIVIEDQPVEQITNYQLVESRVTLEHKPHIHTSVSLIEPPGEPSRQHHKRYSVGVEYAQDVNQHNSHNYSTSRHPTREVPQHRNHSVSPDNAREVRQHNSNTYTPSTDITGEVSHDRSRQHSVAADRELTYLNYNNQNIGRPIHHLNYRDDYGSTLKLQTPSPQHDSAIDNSPSSDLSGAASQAGTEVHRRHTYTPLGRSNAGYRSSIDLEAMETDAMKKDLPKSRQPKTVKHTLSQPIFHLSKHNSVRDNMNENETDQVSSTKANEMLRPYQTRRVNGVSMSQI